MSITARRNRIKADRANTCFIEREHEDDILSQAIISKVWSQVATQIHDHRDANGTAHSASCHRNH